MSNTRGVYHQINPYNSTIQTRTATIYAPDAYRLGLLTNKLTYTALRVLLLMAARVDGDGLVRLSRNDMSDVMQIHVDNVGKGMRELIRHNLIAKNRQYTYWLNPALFQSVSLVAL